MPANLLQQVSQRRAEKIEVLEGKQRAHVHQDAQTKEKFPERRAWRFVNAESIQKIESRKKKEQREKLRIPKRVEIVTGCKQEADSRQPPPCQQPIDEEDCREKYEVVAAGEKHKFLARIRWFVN